MYKHSPTPWSCDADYIRDYLGRTIAEDLSEISNDPEYIVKCVNLHDELVETLKHTAGALEELGYPRGFLRGDWPALDDALALIEKANA